MNRASRSFEVPAELTSLLLDFTVSVLVNKPADLVEYATNYFNRILSERQTSTANANPIGVNENDNNHFGDEDNDSISNDMSKII